MGTTDKYRRRAHALLQTLQDVRERIVSGDAAHDGRTPAQIVARLVATAALDGRTRDRVRQECVAFASRMPDAGQRRRALELFAYVLGDSGRRVLREGEVAVRREDWERLEALAGDVAIDALLLAGEVEAPELPASAADDDYWRAQLATDLEVLA